MNIIATVSNAFPCLALARGTLPAQMGSVHAPTRDHDGLPRPIGAGPDIGAFEYPGNQRAFLTIAVR